MSDLSQQIDDIVKTIWSTLTDLPLQTEPVALDAIRSRGGPTVTGVVHVDGAWHGAVLLQCSDALARTITGAMFQHDRPQPEEVRDAIGEITNMVGGNVKALLPEPCTISLPSVTLGSDYDVAVVGSQPVAVTQLSCAGEPLVVILVERVGDASE